MKKSLSAILVIILTFIGANTLASHFDFNTKSNIKGTLNKDGSQNGNSGDNGQGGRNMISK